MPTLNTTTAFRCMNFVVACLLIPAAFLHAGLPSKPFQTADTCPANIDFEFGSLLNWQTNTGKVTAAPRSLVTWERSNWLLHSGLPIRQELIDRNNATAKDFWGDFPINPPFGGGRYAVKLGSDRNDPNSADSVPNALAEGLRYAIRVPSNKSNFGVVFSYAVVFENPNHPSNIHNYDQQPRFVARVYEPGGDTLECANFTFVASDPLPGFSISDKVRIDSSKGRYPGGVNFALVKYKPWSTVFINLQEYAGRTVYMEFITADCTLRGHFGYAYIDVLECINPVNALMSCDGSGRLTLTAPPGFKSYEWWNSDFSRLLGTGDTVQVVANLKLNEKVHVRVLPFDSYGCEDTLSTTVQMFDNTPTGIRYPTVYTEANMSTPLKARGIGRSVTWMPPTGLDDNKVRNPVFKYDKDLEYLVMMGLENGCMTVDTQMVRILKKPDIHVPDAFSPNGDGNNDLLKIFPMGVKLRRFWVFNRWGQLMFETTDPSQNWDGRFRGAPQPVETYVWIAEGEKPDGSTIRRRGQTILIR